MTSQEDLLEIIEELRSSNSKLFKEECLRTHSKNTEWIAYLIEVYNPFILYGRSGNKNDLQDDLENLKLCRSVNAGITAVTINKVYGKIIPTASKMMKAYDYGKKPKALSFPLWAGKKWDGNYVNMPVTNVGKRFYTSGGIEYIHPDADLNLPTGFVFMAERIHSSGRLGDRRGCSLEGSVGSKFAKPNNTYEIFDCVSLGDFAEGITNITYEERRLFIPDRYRAEEKLIHSLEELEEYLDEFVAEGGEGIVMKQPDMMWKDTKSRKVEFSKWKKRQTADLLCIEEVEGEGNSKGIIGSLRFRDSVGREFNCGSGLSLNGDQPFGYYVGNVVEVEYEHINPEGTYIQPVIVCRREDKSVDDID